MSRRRPSAATRRGGAPAAARCLRLAAIAIGVLILASCRTAERVAGPGPCRVGCPTATCPVDPDRLACAAPLPPPPTVGPWFVCDGGDQCAPAKAVGADGVTNLTAGDTVARFRADDNGPDNDAVHMTISNCACVYAPRFAAVREVVQPLEDAVPLGPRGLAADTMSGEQVDRLPVRDGTAVVGPGAARKALPGVAVQERLGPLAVDQGGLPYEDDGRVRPASHAADDRLELERRAARPLMAVGFDVPVAWTCIKAANVLVGGTAADVVAADRGPATLRFESPGRAELTLCKRAGSDTARTGDELDFTIFMLNSGDRPLADIVLVDALPPRLELIPGSPASSLAADIDTQTADDGAVVVRWRITEPLQPGESGFVRFRTVVR